MTDESIDFMVLSVLWLVDADDGERMKQKTICGPNL